MARVSQSFFVDSYDQETEAAGVKVCVWESGCVLRYSFFFFFFFSVSV
jgi:hypothetical protein